MHRTPRRTRLAAFALPLVLGTVIAASPANAVVAGPQLSVAANTVTEGTGLVVPVRANCVFKKCRYVVTMTSGSAVDGSDFTSVKRRKTVKRNKKLKVNVAIPTLDDAACEPRETFTVRLTGPGAGDPGTLTVADGVQTIDDNDCPAPAQPAPPAQPQPTQPTVPAPPANPGVPGGGGGGGSTPPALPADSGDPVVTNQTLGPIVVQECRTPYWIGQDGAFGSNGFYNKGCTATVKCPVGALTCQVRTESGINLEKRNGDDVSLNSRLRVFSASLTEFFKRDVTCAITDWCRTEDMVAIRGGETASNQCNGVRERGVNRAQVYCSISVEKLN